MIRIAFGRTPDGRRVILIITDPALGTFAGAYQKEVGGDWEPISIKELWDQQPNLVGRVF